MLKKLVIVTAVVAMTAAACSSTITVSDSANQDSAPEATPTEDPDFGEPGGVEPVAALLPFDQCGDFLDYVKTEALERVTPYGLDGGFSIGIPMPVDAEFSGDEAAEQSTSVDDSGAAPPTAAGDDSYSGTNVQVEGVDEADIVKTDGERIVSLVDGQLQVVDVSGAEAAIVGTLRFDEIWPQEILLNGDKVVVFGGGGQIAVPFEEFGIDELEDEGDIAGEAIESYGPTAAIATVDISGEPELESTLLIEGQYLSTRSVGETARVAITSPPISLPFLFPSTPAGEERALEANKQIIAESDLSHWMPDYRLETASGEIEEGQLVDCDRVHRPAEFSGFDILSVLTVDLSEELTPGDATAVVASGETVYASGENLYVATNRWAPPIAFETAIIDDSEIDDSEFDASEFEEKYTTDIHKFSIEGSDPATYLASGEVRGHAINQFAFHEWDDKFFATTTDGSPWGFDDLSESYLTAFEQDGDQLVPIGKVGNIGRGEQVFSVRYIEDQAYVVTFRQVDPLYVVDLSDPTEPAVTGELKIPGFSSYLHPVGDDLLLGVGQDATEEGITTGAKVSLFDVSDPTDPREIDVWTLPGGHSDVEWDHRAFLYWAPEQMAVLPLQSWEEGFAGAVVLRVDRFDGLSERGRVDHEPDGADDVGTTDCTDVGIEDPELAEQFPGILVLICDSNDFGGAVGYYCDSFAAEEIDELAENYGLESDVAEDLALSDDQRLEICWPDRGGLPDPILRSLVIDEDLWTLSRSLLQANDIETLDRLQRVPAR